MLRWLLCCLVACALPWSVLQADNGVLFQYGTKRLDKHGWGPTNAQRMLGVSIHSRKEPASIGVMLQVLLSSYDDGYKASSREVAIGAYAPLDQDTSGSFYLAGGGVLIFAWQGPSSRRSAGKDRGSAPGVWCEAGLHLQPLSGLLLNACVRYSMAQEIRLYGRKVRPGGLMLRAGVGVPF